MGMPRSRSGRSQSRAVRSHTGVIGKSGFGAPVAGSMLKVAAPKATFKAASGVTPGAPKNSGFVGHLSGFAAQAPPSTAGSHGLLYASISE